MVFGTGSGILETKVLYTSRDKATAVAEFLENNAGKEYDVYEIVVKKGSTAHWNVDLPDRTITQNFGDIAKASYKVDLLEVPSFVTGGSTKNLIIYDKSLINLNKVRRLGLDEL